MTTAPAIRPASARISDAFRNESGAFDLPSILVGVVVVGVLTAGVLASIFGVIPFAQDKGAVQDISAVTTAQGVEKAKTGAYASAFNLTAAQLLPVLDSSKVDSKITATGGWATAAKSGSGHVFLATDQNTNPVDVTGTTYKAADGTTDITITDVGTALGSK